MENSSNRTYRIKANPGLKEETSINVHLTQDYDSFSVLSLELDAKDTYKLHNSNYGVIIGRVLANENFGVPNAKLSLFIEGNFEDTTIAEQALYPYTSVRTKDSDGRRYNLLPNEKVNDCHRPVGTFPSKTYLLNNDDIIEVFNDYYIYTTRTNNSGDYMICGVPTGNYTLHMDLDLSDCGILSQKPRDFIYKGYTIEQFENPNEFKTGTSLSSLSQIFSQDQTVNVIPFWGNDEGEEIGITRADVNISFTFEPTCVFMGSVISDAASNGVSQKCVPTNNMGAMDELTTGEGMIEIIRKTPGGNTEEFQVKGNQVINANGVWCYQIPMNLDYMMTDEYGNMVPTDDPNKGIPTRTRVRFRLSMSEFGENNDNYYRGQVLIPNNPDIDANGNTDYNFGTATEDASYRDLFWNNVYTVKSFFPRFQKSKRWKNERFTGIKHCNIYGQNNPLPYNNIRIKLPFMFVILCALIKTYIRIVGILNVIIWVYARLMASFADVVSVVRGRWYEAIASKLPEIKYILIADGLCPDLEDWYFAPKGKSEEAWSFVSKSSTNVLQNTYKALVNGELTVTDNTSIDTTNSTDDSKVCLTSDIDYLLSCIEMNLAQEYKVIQFDFYNDWINGVVYVPRWKRILRKKKKFLLFGKTIGLKVKGCMNGEGTSKTRYYTQQCALEYKGGNNKPFTEVTSTIGCRSNTDGKKINGQFFKTEQCHKAHGMKRVAIFGNKKNGLVTEKKTSRNEYAYYLKPCEWIGENNTGNRALLFATDIVLLGSFKDCDDKGVPQAFRYITSSSYKMPTNLALTTMDDDSYIYTTTGGTICGNSKSAMYTGKGITKVEPTYQNTYNAYTGSKVDSIEYGNNDDAIAVTEAAGIAWNYTGPGQGKDDQDYVYYPGGHFLGLSCTNSKTNIRSCINLQRICEVGSSMSERHELVRGYDNTNQKVLFRYLTPTGFIAQDEINDVAFKSMFATMNHHKLIAEGTDDKTGYPCYEYTYMYPFNFDGSMDKYVSKTGSPYNGKVDVADESSFMENLFKLMGWSQSDDYDNEESGYTETRTIEDCSKDYYKFRMGLDSLKSKDQRKRFLITNGSSSVSLPQYENSFYFYFGLKDGATALDEFKKQFFSECEKRRIGGEPTLKVKTKLDICNLKGDITLEMENMVADYNITIKNKKNGEILNGYNEKREIKDFVTYTGIPFGLYDIIVEDSREETKEASIDLGNSLIKIDIRDVNYRVSAVTQGTGTMGFDGRKGGYLLCDGPIMFNDIPYSANGDDIQICLSGVSGTNFETYEVGGEYKWRIFGLKPDTDYKLSFKFKCGEYDVFDSDGNYVRSYKTEEEAEKAIEEGYGVNYSESAKSFSDKEYEFGTFNLKTNKDIDMLLGCYKFSYKNELKNWKNEWWKDIAHMGEKYWAQRQAVFKQSTDDTKGFDSNIIPYSKSETGLLTATFGYPEKYEGQKYKCTYSGYSDNDYDQFKGYSLSNTDSVLPTYLVDLSSTLYDDNRGFFSAMVYKTDGRAAADVSDVHVTKVEADIDDTNKKNISFSGGLTKNAGCIVVFENGEMVFPFMTSTTEGYYYGEIPEYTGETWLKMAAVYPTFTYPIIHRPFYSEISVLSLSYGKVADADTDSPYIDYSYHPYYMGGKIYNGNSCDNRYGWGSGDTMICDETANILTGTNLDKKMLYTTGNCLELSDTGWPYTVGTEYQKNQKEYFSYKFTQGYPSGYSTDNYSGYTLPNLPDLVTNENYISPGFVNRIMYRSVTGVSSSTVNYLYGDIEAEDEHIKYYDADRIGIGISNNFYTLDGSCSEGATESNHNGKNVWVYNATNSDVREPEVYIACFHKGTSGIKYVRVWTKPGFIVDDVYADIPYLNETTGTWEIERVKIDKGKDYNGSDLMDILIHWDELKTLKNVLQKEKYQLEIIENTILKEPQNGQSFAVTLAENYKSGGWGDYEVELSQKSQFTGTLPSSILAVYDNNTTEDRNELYMFKYYSQILKMNGYQVPGEIQRIDLTPSVVEASYEAGTYNFAISSNADWGLEYGYSGNSQPIVFSALTKNKIGFIEQISKISGNGSTDITFNVKENTGTTKRSIFLRGRNPHSGSTSGISGSTVVKITPTNGIEIQQLGKKSEKDYTIILSDYNITIESGDSKSIWAKIIPNGKQLQWASKDNYIKYTSGRTTDSAITMSFTAITSGNTIISALTTDKKISATCNVSIKNKTVIEQNSGSIDNKKTDESNNTENT